MVKKVVLLFFVAFSVSCIGLKQNYKNTFVVAGTYLEVTSPYKEAAEVVHEEFRRLEKIFNIYDEDSEISLLNKTYRVNFRVSWELIEVLILAKEVYRMTNGAFDVSCGRLYAFWKDLTKQKDVGEFPSRKEIGKLKALCGMEYIELNPQKKTVSIKREGLKIDLSGIAKGYMVDKAVGKLKAKGIESALINAGGDIYCLGKNGKKPWRVGIKDPQQRGVLIKSEELQNEAVATSGGYEQFFEFKEKKYSHLIDPRSGFPVSNSVLSVSVVRNNCVTADSLATAFFVMGPEKIEKFLANKRYNIKVFVVSENSKGEREVRIFQ
ncbi:MAG: FAD:protein FMN transferase [Candidatus Omnitrophota bacterium]|nr:MAG: FAD:protein FMN transferase [Candidatus Omnitrophota bacterium]